MRSAWLLVLLGGCTLYYGPETEDDVALVDAGAPGWDDCGHPYTATIFEPANGGTYPRTLQVRMRWNDAGIPDRYMAMSDHFGNFFQPTDGPGQVLGDGSITNTFTLPANGAFTFEIGWLCNVQQGGGQEAILAKVDFATQP